MNVLILNKILLITGSLVTRSGLRVGGTEAAMSIGGAENPIIRDFWGNPYIPGSSLKGKLRSLLEYTYNKVQIKTNRDGTQSGQPCGCAREDCMACRVFGPHMSRGHNLGPSRIIVRDAPLSEDTSEQINVLLKEGNEFSETKTETMIDRLTGKAATGSLRTQERLPSGAKFDLNISLRIFEGDNEEKMVDFIKEGLSLLEKDYLGGSGTRGYGWVKIEDLKVSDS
jgi:CRISPR-associated protein Csm3